MVLEDGKLVFGVLTARGNNYLVLDRELEGKVEGRSILDKKDISIDGENYVFFDENQITHRFDIITYILERKLWG